MKNQFENPYLNGRAEWLERYGSYIKRARDWQIIAIICLLITTVSVTCNYIQAKQNKVVPYVVAVDKLGTSLAVHRADVASPTPRNVVQAELANVIVNWRTVTADLDLQTRMVNRLSSFMRGSAKGFLTDWFNKNNPHEKARMGRLISVDIKGLPLPVSQDSWRIEWRETMRNHTGALVNVTNYEATMTVKIEPPTTDAQIITNPGGIFITELSFSEILNNKEAAEAPREVKK